MVIIKFRPRETKTTKSGRPIHETKLLVGIGPKLAFCLCLPNTCNSAAHARIFFSIHTRAQAHPHGWTSLRMNDASSGPVIDVRSAPYLAHLSRASCHETCSAICRKQNVPWSVANRRQNRGHTANRARNKSEWFVQLHNLSPENLDLFWKYRSGKGCKIQFP